LLERLEQRVKLVSRKLRVTAWNPKELVTLEFSIRTLGRNLILNVQ
jgi:hypothetical protein